MNKLKQTLEKTLKAEPSFLDSESKELNYIKVKDSADSIDKKLITLLADNKSLRAKFFTKIKDVYVFNIQDFKFFLDESKVDNSYTNYANKIGLSNKNELLENTSDVVLDFLSKIVFWKVGKVQKKVLILILNILIKQENTKKKMEKEMKYSSIKCLLMMK